jgi:hypothetical protein
LTVFKLLVFKHYSADSARSVGAGRQPEPRRSSFVFADYSRSCGLLQLNSLLAFHFLLRNFTEILRQILRVLKVCRKPGFSAKFGHAVRSFEIFSSDSRRPQVLPGSQ